MHETRPVAIDVPVVWRVCQTVCLYTRLRCTYTAERIEIKEWRHLGTQGTFSYMGLPIPMRMGRGFDVALAKLLWILVSLLLCFCASSLFCSIIHWWLGLLVHIYMCRTQTRRWRRASAGMASRATSLGQSPQHRTVAWNDQRPTEAPNNNHKHNNNCYNYRERRHCHLVYSGDVRSRRHLVTVSTRRQDAY